MSEEPLNTSMSASHGKPEAVALLLEQTAKAMRSMPDDMVLSVEVDIWEETDGD